MTSIGKMKETDSPLPVRHQMDHDQNRLRVYVGEKRIASFTLNLDAAMYEPIEMGYEEGKLQFKTAEKAVEWALEYTGYVKPEKPGSDD